MMKSDFFARFFIFVALFTTHILSENTSDRTTVSTSSETTAAVSITEHPTNQTTDSKSELTTNQTTVTVSDSTSATRINASPTVLASAVLESTVLASTVASQNGTPSTSPIEPNNIFSTPTTTTPTTTTTTTSTTTTTTTTTTVASSNLASPADQTTVNDSTSPTTSQLPTSTASEDASDQICLPTWSSFLSTFSKDGTKVNFFRLQDCLAYCEYGDIRCVGIDFDLASSPPCWLHTHSADFNSNEVSNKSTSIQYRINRTCNIVNKNDCPSWTRLENTNSLISGVKLNYSSEFDCFTFCQYTDSCLGASYDILSGQPCSVLLPPVSSMDTVAAQGVTFYRFDNRTSCPPVQSVFTDELSSFGRCSGQMFSNTSWCEPGKYIHVNQTYYRTHPLCCTGNFPVNVSPPDNQRLSSFSISDIDPNYYSEIIRQCEGKNNCSLAAGSVTRDSITNTYCGSGQARTANYVVISYTCDGSPLNITVTTTPKNPDDIGTQIGVGIGMGLGFCLLIAACLIAVICTQKRKRKEKRDLDTSDSARVIYVEEGGDREEPDDPDEQFHEQGRAAEATARL